MRKPIELMEPNDVARELGQYGPAWIARLADSGKIPVFARTVRGGRLFRRCDVERLARERAGQTRPVGSREPVPAA